MSIPTGGFVMALPNGGKIVGYYLTDEQYAKLAEEADEQEYTQPQYARRALLNTLAVDRANDPIEP
jgi:hypothetical protein